MVASVFSEGSAPLSSVPSAFVEEEAEVRISNYQLQDSEDSTQSVLSNFIHFLPTDGKRVLAERIIICDDPTLRALSTHLITCILLPSELSRPSLLMFSLIY